MMHESLVLEYLGAGLAAGGHEAMLLDARPAPGIEVGYAIQVTQSRLYR
jgi:hypothetical protein